MFLNVGIMYCWVFFVCSYVILCWYLVFIYTWRQDDGLWLYLIIGVGFCPYFILGCCIGRCVIHVTTMSCYFFCFFQFYFVWYYFLGLFQVYFVWCAAGCPIRPIFIARIFACCSMAYQWISDVVVLYIYLEASGISANLCDDVVAPIMLFR